MDTDHGRAPAREFPAGSFEPPSLFNFGQGATNSAVAEQSVTTQHQSRSGGYQRKSRKGSPRIHKCDVCERLFSRNEHLERHKLSRAPSRFLVPVLPLVA